MTGEDSQDLQDYLHRHIPLSAAMGITVRSASAEAVTLAAPLEPNINHKSTVFGGSASAAAILSAWSLLHLRLGAEGVGCELVIQSNRMEYDAPIRAGFTATAVLVEPLKWPGFLHMLQRRKRARIAVRSDLACQGTAAGRFEGQFVALLTAGR